MVVRPPVVDKEQVIRFAHRHQCSELSSVPCPVMTLPSTANLDGNSNITVNQLKLLSLSVLLSGELAVPRNGSGSCEFQIVPTMLTGQVLLLGCCDIFLYCHCFELHLLCCFLLS